ncbi:hypothetical protein KUTeg_020067, partial [Tegillarca granosa]
MFGRRDSDWMKETVRGMKDRDSGSREWKEGRERHLMEKHRDVKRNTQRKSYSVRRDTKRGVVIQPPLNIDCIRWDVCNLPFKDESVDVIATDLPFGVRMGSKKNNIQLYPGALQEMARVCRLKTGRACLITSDKKCINQIRIRSEPVNLMRLKKALNSQLMQILQVYADTPAIKMDPQ